MWLSGTHLLNSKSPVPRARPGRPPSARSSSPGRLRVQRRSEDSLALSWSSGAYGLRVWRFPFRLEVLRGDEVAVTFNSRGKLWFEPLRDPPTAAEKGQRSEGKRVNVALLFPQVFVADCWCDTPASAEALLSY